MSALIFPAVFSVNYLETEFRLNPLPDMVDWSLEVDDPVDVLWPRARLGGGDNLLQTAIIGRTFWEWPVEVSGSEGRYTITGFAKDSTGTALAGATVKLYRTTTDEMVDTATSALDGAYSVGTPYSGGHYVVAYVAGTPDTAGTTVNNLAGV